MGVKGRFSTRVPTFEQLIALVLFVSATGMLIALSGAAHQSRLLGFSLVLMAVALFVSIGLHLDRLKDDAMIAVLNVLTGALWLVAGLVCLKKRAA